ncbi:MAG: Smr/MutS family protein [bacterium]|nr:Smr/MutS family protein [bacterium]
MSEDKSSKPDEFAEPGEIPVEIPIEDYLDLHTFRPSEIPDLLQDYLEACRERGIYQVRLIHGKGTGRLREKVHHLLRANPLVHSFSLAPPQSGSWGATIVLLKRQSA